MGSNITLAVSLYSPVYLKVAVVNTPSANAVVGNNEKQIMKARNKASILLNFIKG
jgi:hypothetical protein